MGFLIHHSLEESADKFPERQAVVHGDHQATYSEIELRANQIANYLMENGVVRGDRVALLHRNSVSYVVFYFAILKTGAAVVPLSTGVEPQDTIAMLTDCQARLLLSESQLINPLVESSLALPNTLEFVLLSDPVSGVSSCQDLVLRSISEVPNSYPSHRPLVSTIDGDLSTIVYTSGSTGKPKGVMLSHLNIVTNTRSIVSYLGLDSTDRCMVILPFYYVFGKSLLNTHFAVAGTVIIDNRFTFPNAVLKTMITERATSFSGVPATFSILLNRSSIAKLDFPDLRYFSQAGGHLPAAVREKLADLFPDKQIFVMYGATEASARLAFLDPSQFSRKLTSFGKAIPNVELRVISQGGDESAPNEEGEIIARGSNVMMGYWNSPEETEKALRDAWYFTGDLGYRDHDGDFHVTGRKRDMIKVGIHKVSAREIEEVLYRHPDITEVAAFGVPDDDLGEAVKAVVVAAPAASIEETELREFCRERLAAHKVPKTLQFASSLPRNEAGKIMRRELTTLFRDLR